MKDMTQEQIDAIAAAAEAGYEQHQLHPALSPELRELRRKARAIRERFHGKISTHYEGCGMYHLECFAEYVLSAIHAEQTRLGKARPERSA